jgi:hypothetical protein
VEPFGSPVDDERSGTIAATLLNVNRAANTAAVSSAEVFNREKRLDDLLQEQETPEQEQRKLDVFMRRQQRVKFEEDSE